MCHPADQCQCERDGERSQLGAVAPQPPSEHNCRYVRELIAWADHRHRLDAVTAHLLGMPSHLIALAHHD